jgi:RES domain-containing protein
MVSNKEEQLTGSTCYLAQNSFLFTSNVTAAVVQSAYIHIHIQGVSEKGQHILDTWSVDRNKGKASKMCLRRRSFFIMITSGINPHENNISGRTMAGLLPPLSNSYSTHANLPHHVIQVSALYCYT